MDELSDKEKTRLLLQDIMECFILDDSAYAHGHLTFARGLQAPPGFHWPIAFWDSDVEVWLTKDIATDPVIFNPLHGWTDAWAVLKNFYEHHAGDGELHAPFAYHLGVTFATPDGLDAFQMNLDQLVNLTPEKICLAVLKARGKLK